MDVLRRSAAILVVSAVSLTISLALGALLFAADPALAPAGVSIALFSSAVVGFVIAVRGSVPGTLAGIQDSPTILLAIGVGALAGAGAELPPERRLATALAFIAVTTLLTGAVAYLLGRLHLGSLLRFMPYPVVGGFLAGTGWLLVAGAVEVTTGVAVSSGAATELLSVGLGLRWVPPLVIAALLLWLLEHHGHPLLMPGALVVLVGGFYGLWMLSGNAPSEALAQGWLLGPFTEAAGWRPDPLAVLTQADWSLVVGQAGKLASVLLVVLVSVVLTAGGLELALHEEVDVDRELRATGLGNLVAGAFGGSIGYTWLSDTVLARALGARGRATGVIVAGVAVLALLLGTAPLAWFPRPALATLLMLLGLAFLQDWLVRTWRRMPRIEYAIVASILVTIATFGFMRGVAFGILLAVALFVVAASRIDVVKHALSGVHRASQVDRSDAQQLQLQHARGHIHILVLQGFLFFGTAHSVGERVLTRVEDADEPRLRFAVLDLRLVTGLDSSAVFAVAKLRRRLADAGAVLVLSTVPADVARSLRSGEVLGADGVVLRDTLDHALEWCEDQLLGDLAVGGELADLAAAVRGLLPADTDATALLRHMEVRSLPAGWRLIEQGQPSGGIHLVVAGTLRVERTLHGDETLRLRLLRAGAVTGEMSVYLGAPATASVIAVTDVTVGRLAAPAFAALEREAPELAAVVHRTMVRLVAVRLADSNRAVEALLD